MIAMNTLRRLFRRTPRRITVQGCTCSAYPTIHHPRWCVEIKDTPSAESWLAFEAVTFAEWQATARK